MRILNEVCTNQTLAQGPISAIAARKARQRLAEVEQAPSSSPANEEPPLKKVRASTHVKQTESAVEKRKVSRRAVEVTAERVPTKSTRSRRTPPQEPSPLEITEGAEAVEDGPDGESAAESTHGGVEDRYIWPKQRHLRIALTDAQFRVADSAVAELGGFLAFEIPTRQGRYSLRYPRLPVPSSEAKSCTWRSHVSADAC